MRLARRSIYAKLFKTACFSLTILALVILGLLLYDIGKTGFQSLNWEFLTSYPSRFAESAGIKSALLGSLWLMVLTIIIAVPIGVASAIYLEEILPQGLLKNFINVNIGNLAGVPSIVYGMLGLTVFVRALALERSLIAGALTLSILILPVIVISSQEALRAIPNTLRLAALALGATKWQVVRAHILPAALPTILTGVILAISRAIGETAPLILVGGVTYIAFSPENIFDSYTALPIQIFNWASRPQLGFQAIAAAGIIVLLAVLLSFTLIAILLRNYFQRKNLCHLL